MNSRRTFIKRGALFVPFIFAPKLIRAQGLLAKKQSVGSLNQRVVGGGGGPFNMITGQVNGSLDGWNPDFKGCKITISGTAIQVTQIGVYLSATDGYWNATPVQIRAADGTTVVKAATVDLSGGNNTVGYHYCTAFAAVTLNASTVYFLCCSSGFQSMCLSTGTAVTTRAEVTVNDSASESGGVMTVESFGTGVTYGPIDLVYTT